MRLVRGQNPRGKFVKSLSRTPLIEAARNGNLGQVQELIRQGVQVDEADTFGTTALMYACWFGFYEIARYLLEAGAEVNKPTRPGRTTLMIAVMPDSRRVPDETKQRLVSLLLQHGADAQIRDTFGRNAADYAAWHHFRSDF